MLITAAEATFVLSIALIAYTYVCFPVALFIRSLMTSSPPVVDADQTPPVSIIIAARNEEASIGAKLDSVMDLDYSADLVDVIVVSDGSTDGTASIVEGFADRGVRLIDQPWLGKAAALQTAVDNAKHDILIFTDANSLLDRSAVSALAGRFSDPEVGGVAGNQVYTDDTSSATVGERSYWRLDRLLKQTQSKAGDVVSATGALYAIRRIHFGGVAEWSTDDFYLSTGVVADGSRLIFEPVAIAREAAAESVGNEFARKVRVMTRGLYGVWLRRTLLNPFTYGFYSFQLFWHKVLRRMMAFPLLSLFASSVVLALQSRGFLLIAAVQSAIYIAGLAALVLPERRSWWRRIIAIVGYFCMVNAAAVVATTKLLRGQRIGRWQGGAVRQA